jgi:phosphoglycolate phosphatase
MGTGGPRAILFDLDGTLVDSLTDIAASLQHVLASLGLPTHSLEAVRGFVGEGARHLVQSALPPGSTEADVDRALALYKERYRTHLVVATRPYEGLPALLASLVRRDVALGVVTNKPHAPAEELVARLFAPRSFGVVVGDRPGRARKPDAAPALEAAAALGVPPERCLFVGDTAIDVRTAHAAGMTSVGVTWGLRDRDELDEARAHHVVTSVPELAALLDAWLVD